MRLLFPHIVSRLLAKMLRLAAVARVAMPLLCSCSILMPAATATARQTMPKSAATTGLETKLRYPLAVKAFYASRAQQLFWFSGSRTGDSLRQILTEKVDSCGQLGLDKKKYHASELSQYVHAAIGPADTARAMAADRIFTDAAFGCAKDIYQGNGHQQWMSSDEISPQYDAGDNQFLLGQLTATQTAADLNSFFGTLEPSDAEYSAIKAALLARPDSLSHLQHRQLISSLQLLRWMHHFNFPRWVVVNVASATLRYEEGDHSLFFMKVVVGRPSSRTPRIATFCDAVVLYPYWNVPRSIAVNELLPEFKRNPGDVDALNMQVLNSEGKVIDHHHLNWKPYNSHNFPFRLRQCTGCDNSLGVMKFNLTSPFSVYLHDTNNKTAFLSGLRYYSHGCIRIEDPIALAEAIIPGKVDSNFVELCLKNQQPISLPVKPPVPVFVIYQTVEKIGAGPLKYFSDVYRILGSSPKAGKTLK